jgi:hypothetical protein
LIIGNYCGLIGFDGSRQPLRYVTLTRFDATLDHGGRAAENTLDDSVPMPQSR